MQASAPHQAHHSPQQKLTWLLTATLCLTICISTVATSFAHKTPASQVAAGKRWFVKYGCDVCHTTDGSDSFGGTLKGIYGTHATLEDGKILLRDDAYFRAKIAFSAQMPLANGTNTMPIYKDSLSTQQMTAIIAMIKSLRTTKTGTSRPASRPIRRAASRPISLPFKWAASQPFRWPASRPYRRPASRSYRRPATSRPASGRALRRATKAKEK